MKVRFCLDCADVAAQVSWLRQRLRQRQRQRQRVATWLMKMLLKCDTLRCLTVLATPTCCLEGVRGGGGAAALTFKLSGRPFVLLLLLSLLRSFFFCLALFFILLVSLFGQSVKTRQEDKKTQQSVTRLWPPSAFTLFLSPFLLAYLLLALIKQRCCCCCCCCRKFFGGNLPTNKQE